MRGVTLAELIQTTDRFAALAREIPRLTSLLESALNVLGEQCDARPIDGVVAPYGDITSKRVIAFLDGYGTIEDWGCGLAHAKTFLTNSEYVGIDGSSKWADRIADLAEYTSDVDCIFMQHVLEHNAEWRPILTNAIASFRKRMVLVIFTPFGETTRQIGTTMMGTSILAPHISFRKEDLTAYFNHLAYVEESVESHTQYGREHVFYLVK